MLAGVVGRRKAFLAPLAAIGARAAGLWLPERLGLPGARDRLPDLRVRRHRSPRKAAGPTKRPATGLSTGVLAVAFTLRAVPS